VRLRTGGEYVKAREYKAEKIIPTAFGLAMADILYRKRKITQWNQPFQEKPESDFDYDEMMLQFLFDNIKNLDEANDKKIRELENLIKEKNNPQENSHQSQPFFKAFIPFFPEGVLKKTII
jgi:hypothetical protein